MPGKMARSPPSAVVRSTNHDDVVLAANRSCQNAATARKSHPGLGFIWGIPVKNMATGDEAEANCPRLVVIVRASTPSGFQTPE